jgi:hypothetical protein
MNVSGRVFWKYLLTPDFIAPATVILAATMFALWKGLA